MQKYFMTGWLPVKDVGVHNEEGGMVTSLTGQTSILTIEPNHPKWLSLEVPKPCSHTFCYRRRYCSTMTYVDYH